MSEHTDRTALLARRIVDALFASEATFTVEETIHDKADRWAGVILAALASSPAPPEPAPERPAPTCATWQTVESAAPPRHARHFVRRDGLTFIATPCYGMHAPWWVPMWWVPMSPTGETDPIAMQPADEWQPVPQETR